MMMNLTATIRKMMGWCPNVHTGHVGTTMPEIDIKNLEKPWLKPGKNLCSKDVEVLLIAVIWVSVILGISSILRGTAYMNQILPILGGGSFASILILNTIRKKK